MSARSQGKVGEAENVARGAGSKPSLTCNDILKLKMELYKIKSLTLTKFDKEIDNMRPCVDVVLDDKAWRVEVLDDEVPPLPSPDEFASPRLSDNLRQLPKYIWYV